MSLKQRITDDMKAAMRAKEAERLNTIRMLLAAMKQKEVDERVVLENGVSVYGQFDAAARWLPVRSCSASTSLSGPNATRSRIASGAV